LDLSEKQSLLAENSELVAGFKPVGEILDEAISDGASDIHIEPASSDYRVRFRINSLLHERNHYPVPEGRRIVALLKAVSEMDHAECAKPQEGRFRLRSPDREIEFRLATSETIHGEKLVLRLMERTKEILDLDALGIQETHMNLLQEVLPIRSGLVVVAGPTGSGTTSTIYAMLARLDSKTRNIMTVEDPTEYELPGTTQISVNPKSDITFASGLKSILRQDPDVIFLGELRDRETAGMVATASLEHLVFTSLQSTGVLDVLESLRGLGIEPYQLAATLRLIIAQRRVRVLCKHCRQPYEAEGNELESVGIVFEPGSILYAAAGCENCRDSGFSGWTGLFEFLPVGEEIAQALADGQDASSIMAGAAARGFRTFNHDGAQKILLGRTTVQEVIGTN